MEQTSFFQKNKHYIGNFFILGLNTISEEFIVGIVRKNEIVQLGSFSKGLSRNEKEILKKTILDNQNQVKGKTILIEPGICVELVFQSIKNDQLVNPTFQTFQFERKWNECTWDSLIIHNSPITDEIKFTNPDKILWKKTNLSKESFISYLAQISSFMLPFLENRLLTTIRFPNGVDGESFFQKNCPDYAPSFIKTIKIEDIKYIICNDLSTLLWLGNQSAIEFHVPFEKINCNDPLEIVFDLDPPNKDAFPLAIKAAIELRQIFESFKIKSYPKVSGSKGLQIHIPLNNISLSYDDTRIFTSFIANYLIEKYPDDFTIERFKKNRGNRLYIDYVQHAKGKTIVCPYSARGKELPTVAAPLYWDEVNHNLKIETYDIPYMVKRVEERLFPMVDYFEHSNLTLLDIISTLKENR